MRFWSDPDTELKLAKDTGVQVFRMGIDWTRIMPEEPVNGLKETVSEQGHNTIVQFGEILLGSLDLFVAYSLKNT